MRAVLTIISVCLLVSLSFSATIYVPDNYPTIQDAINASVNGDTVVIRPGTYSEDVDFLGKAITVRSEWGPEATLIEGVGTNYYGVVTFKSGEKRDSVLEGFTISNGLYRGGIFCQGSSPTIRGNIVRDNYSNSDGGGITVDTCEPVITGNVITRNITNSHGGGIATTSRKYVGNHIEITNNIISKNTASNFGGGLYFMEFEGPWKKENFTPVVLNNVIADNQALRGGGVYLSVTGAVVIGNMIYSNAAALNGGGVWVRSSELHLANNTIVYNSSSRKGGGIAGAVPIIANSILWGNSLSQITSIHNVNYCNVMGGWPGVGNFDSDPRFSDRARGDFHLTWNSPCRDAGKSRYAKLPRDLVAQLSFCKIYIPHLT